MRGLKRDRCSIQAFFSETANGAFCPVVPCSGPFDAFPECEEKIVYAYDVRPDSWFEKRELMRDRCSIQAHFSETEYGAYCPAVPLPSGSDSAPVEVPVEAPVTSDDFNCPGPFDAFPECEAKVSYAYDVRPDSWFDLKGITRDRCSIQKYWAEDSNGAYCPAV
jgi:hypothetical protein